MHKKVNFRELFLNYIDTMRLICYNNKENNRQISEQKEYLNSGKERSTMAIFRLTPAFKDYIWGGTRLRDEYGKKCEFDKVAESWELSCHKDGASVVADGADKGLTLQEYIDKHGKQVLGSDCQKFDEFPVLIKLIDAKDNLSVQVHPNDEYALKVEGEYGKTEMWYIVDCDEGAELLYGFKHEISKEEFAARIADNTLLEVTNNVPVHKGDVFFIEAGTLHAIGKGILIAEIQQNSNTTYRIYDYGRVGKDGKPRELHIDKAKDVTRLAPAKKYAEADTVINEGYNSKLMASCDYFTTYVLNINGKAELEADDKSFNSLLILDGEAEITSNDGSEKIKAVKGDSVFVTSGSGKYSVSGNCQAILTKV